MTKLPIGVSAGNVNFPGDWNTVVEKVKLADQLGYHSVWVAEAWGYDLVSRLTELALVTKQIKLGWGIANVFSRSPGVMAMTAATLDELSGGRFILGLGSSGQNVIEHWHGVPFDRPLRRIREYVEIVNMILRGERLVYRGEIFSLERGFKLQFKPLRNHIPVYIASLTPRSIDQSGAIADGILPTFWPTSRLGALRQQLDAATIAAGRPAGSVAIAMGVGAQVIADESQRAAARQKVREPIAFYIGRMGRFYAEMLSRNGYPNEVAAIQSAWRDGPQAANDALPDAMLDDIATIGTIDEVRATLATRHALGINEPHIGLPDGTPDQAAKILEALIRP